MVIVLIGYGNIVLELLILSKISANSFGGCCRFSVTLKPVPYGWLISKPRHLDAVFYIQR